MSKKTQESPRASFARPSTGFAAKRWLLATAGVALVAVASMGCSSGAQEVTPERTAAPTAVAPVAVVKEAAMRAATVEEVGMIQWALDPARLTEQRQFKSSRAEIERTITAFASAENDSERQSALTEFFVSIQDLPKSDQEQFVARLREVQEQVLGITSTP